MTAAPDHKARAHSALGASVAHRWMACPGSIRLCAGIPNTETIFAAEGTAAHELAEKSLTHQSKAVGAWIDETIVVGNHTFTVDEEMAEAVQLYFDTVMGDMQEGDELSIEHRFDLSGVHPGMFGTNDASIYRPSTGELIVYDYKHGKGYAVEATENPQLLYYALGAANEKQRSLTSIEVVIVQPRAPHKDGPVRRWKTDAMSLVDWAADLKAAAVATEDPNAPVAAGSWCKFCPAAGTCPALREKAVASAQLEFAEAPAELTDVSLTAIMETADLVSGWVKAVYAEAYNRIAAGREVPGWKLVQKRATRKWVGEDDFVGAEIAMELGADEATLFVRKLRSPAALEKLLPKGDRKALGQWITAESSGTTLAREEDRRPKVNPSALAADDFDPVE